MRLYPYIAKGVTLIELMVVVVIIAILAAMAIPTFNKTMENAREREAKATLDLVYNAQKIYRIDKKYYSTDFASGFLSYIEDPNTTSDYYNFSIASSDNKANFTATAQRKGGTKTFTVNQAGQWTETP